jgi:hypothetical protein
MVENNVLFTKNRGNGKKSEETLIVDDEHVTIQSRKGGSVVVNFRGSESEIKKILEFFNGMNEVEPLMLNIAGSGDVDHYYRGISEISQEDGMFKIRVTLQFLATTV